MSRRFEIGDVVRLRRARQVYYGRGRPHWIQAPTGAIATVTGVTDGISVAFWAYNQGVTARGFSVSAFELVRKAEPC